MHVSGVWTCISCACAHVHTWMWSPEVATGCLAQSLHIIYWGIASHLYPELTHLALLWDLLFPSPNTSWAWRSHEFTPPKQQVLTSLKMYFSEEPSLVPETESWSTQDFFTWGAVPLGHPSKAARNASGSHWCKSMPSLLIPDSYWLLMSSFILWIFIGDPPQG